MMGPGKYDDLCTYVRNTAKASGAIVMVFAGEKGSGFSVQAPLPLVAKLPDILREMARDIEEGPREN